MFEFNLKNLDLRSLDLKKIDLKKIRSEVVKAANYENLKKEIHKLTHEITQLKLYEKLSPQNQQRIKDLEIHFQRLLENVFKAQQNFEKEIHESITKFKKVKTDVSETLERLKKRAMDQKEKVATKSTPTQSKKTSKSTKPKRAKGSKAAQ